MPNVDIVNRLVDAASIAMEKASDFEVTTPSEIISATFTLLDRTLYAMEKLQTAEQRNHNTKLVANMLQEMLVTHGQIPS